jgi:hypothetical protein
MRYKLGQFEDKHYDIRECDKIARWKRAKNLLSLCQTSCKSYRPSQQISSRHLKKLPSLSEERHFSTTLSEGINRKQTEMQIFANWQNWMVLDKLRSIKLVRLSGETEKNQLICTGLKGKSFCSYTRPIEKLRYSNTNNVFFKLKAVTQVTKSYTKICVSEWS